MSIKGQEKICIWELSERSAGAARKQRERSANAAAPILNHGPGLADNTVLTLVCIANSLKPPKHFL